MLSVKGQRMLPDLFECDNADPKLVLNGMRGWSKIMVSKTVIRFGTPHDLLERESKVQESQ